MKNIKKVAVLGGGGRTGKYLVNQLLEKGFM
jgi:nucleoside-diphosphate-sugar epimerase